MPKVSTARSPAAKVTGKTRTASKAKPSIASTAKSKASGQLGKATKAVAKPIKASKGKMAPKKVVSVAPKAASKKGAVGQVKTKITSQVLSGDASSASDPRLSYLNATAVNPSWVPGLVDQDLGPLPNDEVFDEADSAQHNQLRELAEVQRRALLANRPETHPDFDGKHCVECDVVIPRERLALKKVRCVHCQRDLEERNARRGRE